MIAAGNGAGKEGCLLAELSPFEAAFAVMRD